MWARPRAASSAEPLCAARRLLVQCSGRRLVAAARPQPQAFRKLLEQLELPLGEPLPLLLLLAARRTRLAGNRVADQLADARGERIAVVGRGREADDATAMHALDKRIVVEREE